VEKQSRERKRKRKEADEKENRKQEREGLSPLPTLDSTPEPDDDSSSNDGDLDVRVIGGHPPAQQQAGARGMPPMVPSARSPLSATGERAIVPATVGGERVLAPTASVATLGRASTPMGPADSVAARASRGVSKKRKLSAISR